MFAKRLLLFSLAALLLAVPGAQAQEAFAVLVNATGEVIIVRNGASSPAAFGAGLQPGDVVRTGQEGQAAVLYQSGELMQLVAGSEFTVQTAPDDGVLAQISSAGVSGFAQTASSNEGLAALPTLRSAGEDFAALYPRSTSIRETSPEFQWIEVDDVIEYSIHLQGDGDAAGTYVADASGWSLPSEASLDPGVEWTWTIEAMTDDGSLTSEPVTFRSATSVDGEGVARLEASLSGLLGNEDEVRADAATYVLASACGSNGFYGEAILRLEDLVARHPENTELYRQLGTLYQAVGRNASAAQAYRRALDDE